MEKENNVFKKIQISIANSDDINSWSSGEVTKPETINYKTHKPEKDGLFDEVIFGPTKDYKCPVCGKKHKKSDAGKLCTNCGKATIESKMVCRRKMGHIKLEAPVSHIWFSKVNYSAIRSIIGLKQEDLDSVIYFKTHIVVDSATYSDLGDIVKIGKIITVQDSPDFYVKILREISNRCENERDKAIINEKIETLVEATTSEIGRNYGIDFYDYNNFIYRYSKIKINTGASALKEILENLNLEQEAKNVKNELKSKALISSSLIRRLKIIESFLNSEQKPATMIFDYIPVIPADLRPLIQLDGGRHSTVDINELYRRVIIRNNRLKKWIQIGAPDLITQNEKRMLQESVDALFDNSRKKIPINSKDNRPLKSFAENLKGKQGRFRQNLLGKRVDYSGRSVIVVGPELKLHQVGLPKQMAVKLFEPFIVNLLVKEEVAHSIKEAKKMIEVYDDKIWRYASRVIRNHPVLLNRAPTLHRLSVQAFEPIITSGKAIRLHPLVTPSFNADFDGDQMAVHVPLSKMAKLEANNLMISSKNILGPKDGKLILSPSQDIILGLYYLTKTNLENLKSIVIGSYEEMEKNLLIKTLHIHDVVAIHLSLFPDKFRTEIENGQKYFITTIGRIILNSKLPSDFNYINNISDEDNDKYFIEKSKTITDKINELAVDFLPFKKSHVAKLIELVFAHNRENIANTLDEIKDLGFYYSMISGASMSTSDIIDLPNRINIIADGDKRVFDLKNLADEGLITDDERYQSVLQVWSKVKDDIKDNLEEELQKEKNNTLYMMMDSGARGNISNFVQLAGMRGSMAKATHEYAALKRQGIVVRSIEEIPIKSSFKSGLTSFEYFLSTHGARKGLSDTATKTAESGYLTRRLVDAVQDVTIVEEDCKADIGLKVKAILDTRTGAPIEALFDRIVGRVAVSPIRKNLLQTIVDEGEYITEDLAKKIIAAGIEEVEIRTPLTCGSKRGICKKCFGIDLTTNSEVNIGEAVGIISAQSIGEPGTQLTMRTFHTGGVAGVADITQGFTRLMELVDANKNPKFSAIISKTAGTVEEISELNISKVNDIVLDYKLIIDSGNEQLEYIIPANQVLRVKVGDRLVPGQKITEGAVRLQDLLDFAGPFVTQIYLIKEIQRLYRAQGINISDKYIEVIVNQMLSKFKVFNSGDSNLYVSQIISKDKLKELNYDLFKNGKKEIYAKQIILGVKILPLHSESFLSAASYQRTAESLVNAAIEKKVDNLYGIKENLIIGNKIPVGTGLKHPQGKYNLKSAEPEKYEDDYNLANEAVTANFNVNVDQLIESDDDFDIIVKNDSAKKAADNELEDNIVKLTLDEDKKK